MTKNSFVAKVTFKTKNKKTKQKTKATITTTTTKSALFWFRYIEILHLYHEFIRSIRSEDLKLYIYCLLQITNCFLNFNQMADTI